VLVVDKPAGPTSHDVVDRARRALGERRIGHTGTLDPFATGVLPLCVGKATRLSRFLSADEKTYRATVRLGFATTTDDLTGEPLSTPRRVAVDGGAVRLALSALVGCFDQVPPAFSARHVGGRRAYELARRGFGVPRVATPVTVHAIELVGLQDDRIDIEVRCSAGTYVRALARDLGERLQAGGHLTALRRTRSGPFDLSQAVALDALDGGAAARVLPLEALLTQMPAVRVPASSRQLVRNGRDLAPGDVLEGFPAQPVERVRLLDEAGRLIALATPQGLEPSAGELPRFPALHPDVVLLD